MWLYTKIGFDCTSRFSGLAKALTKVPARFCIIDGEVVASDTRGLPDFRALHFCNAEPDDLAVWAFDLLFYNGKDVRNLPLLERKALLTRLVLRTADNHLYLFRPSVTA